MVRWTDSAFGLDFEVVHERHNLPVDMEVVHLVEDVARALEAGVRRRPRSVGCECCSTHRRTATRTCDGSARTADTTHDPCTDTKDQQHEWPSTVMNDHPRHSTRSIHTHAPTPTHAHTQCADGWSALTSECVSTRERCGRAGSSDSAASAHRHWRAQISALQVARLAHGDAGVVVGLQVVHVGLKIFHEK